MIVHPIFIPLFDPSVSLHFFIIFQILHDHSFEFAGSYPEGTIFVSN